MGDLQLPSSFVRLIAAIREGGWPYFVLKENVDAYGDGFDGDLEIVIRDPESVRWVSHLLLSRLLRRGNSGPLARHPQETGDPIDSKFPPTVTDFTGVILFGRSGAGTRNEDTLYALDYRDGQAEPSVICWQNGRWRCVAPDFATFIGLYELAPNRFQESDVGYWEMEEARIARTIRALARM